MLKKLHLSNLGIYWNHQETNLVPLSVRDLLMDNMEGIIAKKGEKQGRIKRNYLILMNSLVDLKQNDQRGKFEPPNI